MNSGLDTAWRGLRDALDGALGSEAVFACLALGLACVFALSGVPKLRKPELAALAIVDFGVLSRARTWTGAALGGFELALAAALAISPLVTRGAPRTIVPLIAAGLLWFFVLLLARALSGDRSFSCYCFGSDESTIGSGTVARTAALAVLATAALVASLASGSASSGEQWALALVVAGSAVGIYAVLARIPSVLKVSA